MFSSGADDRMQRRAVLPGRRAAESGFTLIELMVVLLIIAILLAIAIPTFLGTTSAAYDRAAQSNLNTGLNAAQGFYGISQTFPTTVAQLHSAEPSVQFVLAGTDQVTGKSTAPNQISFFPVDVAVAGDQAGIVMTALSQTGYCWAIATIEGTPTPPSGVPNPSGWAMETLKGGTYYGVFKVAGTGQYCQAVTVAETPTFWVSSYPPEEPQS